MATPAASHPQPKAPILGSFPLDHFRECKAEIEQYYVCLKANNYCTPMCRDYTRNYLKCRMDRGLMKQADVNAFGLPETEFVPQKQHKEDIRQKYFQQKVNQISPLWEAVFKRDDVNVPDGYEREKSAAVATGSAASTKS
jgi:cytochrome c oxidase assembly protein subunit 19